MSLAVRARGQTVSACTKRLRSGLESKGATYSPPLKWAGGKRWLVDRLRPIWEHHEHRRLVEPLSGGIAVALGLMPRHALLNDINSHAINFFRWVKRGLRVRSEATNDRNDFFAARDRFNSLILRGKHESQEAAALFYYLNRTCYNGLCRFNRRGEFNVPFGRYAKINYTSNFRLYKPLFANWEFSCGDFEKLRLDPGDFVYADPPYDVEFRQYSKQGFSWQDQVRLAEWLALHPGPVVLSNQATARINTLYRQLGFSLEFLSAPRMISCTGDRRRAPEVLASRGL